MCKYIRLKMPTISRHLYYFCQILPILFFYYSYSYYSCNNLKWPFLPAISSANINARALKLGSNTANILNFYIFAFWAAPLGWPRPQGPPKSKTGSFSSFTSICIPEVSLNHRATKLGRNVHLHRLSKISNVFFRTPGRARSASRNAKTRYWLLLSNYLR